MSVEFYCTLGCKSRESCSRRTKDVRSRNIDGNCTYAYDAQEYQPAHRWNKEGNPPRCWVALDGTLVYRCLADYYDS